MSQRRFLLTVGTKLPIAMVGRQIIPTNGDPFHRLPKQLGNGACTKSMKNNALVYLLN
jgi:hypothetical protein